MRAFVVQTSTPQQNDAVPTIDQAVESSADPGLSKHGRRLSAACLGGGESSGRMAEVSCQQLRKRNPPASQVLEQMLPDAVPRGVDSVLVKARGYKLLVAVR
jgi:hypothetical protein